MAGVLPAISLHPVILTWYSKAMNVGSKTVLRPFWMSLCARLKSRRTKMMLIGSIAKIRQANPANRSICQGASLSFNSLIILGFYLII